MTDSPPDPVEIHDPHHQAFLSIQKILGQSILCTLDDGRTVRGTFMCLDRLKNIILTNVVEERFIDIADYQYPMSTEEQKNMSDPTETLSSIPSTDRILPVKRYLGQAMIPGERLVKVEIDRSIHDQVTDGLAATVTH